MRKEKGTFTVDFDMVSLQLLAGEENSIFNEGFCGANAMKSGKSGSGIGMFKAYKMLKLNDATIEFKSRISPMKKHYEKYNYEHNSIEIAFPCENDWFSNLRI